jgi:CheY-like chemotaxis protein
MPEGGTLTLAAAAEEVVAGHAHPMGLKPGRYVRLAVSDTGTGMDQRTLERALEPFFTTKPQDKGTGLGLPMAKGFAEQSGGALAIESASGQGTTVTLWLPVADAQQEVAQVQPGLTPVAGLARRVLVVDDEDMVRETLVASLEEAGFAVLAAENGVEALALLDAGEPVDALVTDLAMPGMGGIALIREVHARRPGMPTVLLTGYAGEAAHLAVSGTPPNGFLLLRKPVSAAQIVDRIEWRWPPGSGRRCSLPSSTGRRPACPCSCRCRSDRSDLEELSDEQRPVPIVHDVSPQGLSVSPLGSTRPGLTCRLGDVTCRHVTGGATGKPGNKQHQETGKPRHRAVIPRHAEPGRRVFMGIIDQASTCMGCDADPADAHAAWNTTLAARVPPTNDRAKRPTGKATP